MVDSLKSSLRHREGNASIGVGGISDHKHRLSLDTRHLNYDGFIRDARRTPAADELRTETTVTKHEALVNNVGRVW